LKNGNVRNRGKTARSVRRKSNKSPTLPPTHRATGKTDPFFYIRSVNSNLEDTAMTKLLINKVILAWKHILREKLEVANYITTAFFWVGGKAKLNPILYESIGQNFLMYHLQQTFLDRTYDPGSTKSLWDTAIESYNKMYPDWPPANDGVIPNIIGPHLSLWDTAIESYNEMYPDWPPANDGMIPRHIWRYINDKTTSLQQATITQQSSRGIEDQEESETNENRPLSLPVTPRKKKSSKKRNKANKRKHGGGEPNGSGSSDSDTVD
jgi:hypothetical protein